MIRHIACITGFSLLGAIALTACSSSGNHSSATTSENALTSVPMPVATFQQYPAALAIDAGSVYWLNENDGTVMTVSKFGGLPIVLARGQSGPLAVAADSANVYWLRESLEGDGAVMKIAKFGGAPVTLADHVHFGGVGTIAVDTTHVYWSSMADGVQRVKKAGQGAVEQVASGPAAAVALDNKNVFWAKGWDTSGNGAGAIERTDKSSLATTELVGASEGGLALALDDRRVFWRASDGQLKSTIKEGGGAFVPLAKVAPSGPIAVAGGYVYAPDYQGGAVIRATVEGTSLFHPETVASGQSLPNTIAADESGVFWTNVGTFLFQGPGPGTYLGDGSVMHATES